MLLNHYNGISLLFKGLIVKNFRELPNNSFEVSLEMSRQEQICPQLPRLGTEKSIDYILRINGEMAGWSLLTTQRKL